MGSGLGRPKNQGIPSFSKPSPLPILQKQQKNHEKYREIVRYRRSARKKGPPAGCLPKKERAGFQNGEGIAGTAIQTR